MSYHGSYVGIRQNLAGKIFLLRLSTKQTSVSEAVMDVAKSAKGQRKVLTSSHILAIDSTSLAMFMRLALLS